jgi:hypothetical protein
LPESNKNQTEFIGKGLVERGLISPAHILSLDFSLLCICDYCKKNFRLQNQHLSMSPLVHLFCESGYHTLLAEPTKSLDLKRSETWPEFEDKLPKCGFCNGNFRIMNPFRCPNCSEAFIDYENNSSYRIHDINAINLYGQKYQYWPPK